MENGGAARLHRVEREPRYEGEDVSPTTDRELRGFYAYSLAAEVFAVCGVGSFLPVTLEQLARERGVLWSDRTTPCMVKTGTEASNSVAARILSRAAESDNNQCIVHVLGFEMTTSSYAMYTFSLAVLVQALALVSFSSVADHGTYRKKLLLSFAFTGAVCSMLFMVVVPQIFLAASLLTIISVTCLGSSFVLLNSYLPLLVANHPDTRRGEDNIHSISEAPGPLSPSLRRRASSEHDGFNITRTAALTTDATELKLSTLISSKGVGIGYLAAVFVQLLSILILFFLSKMSVSSTLALRLVLLLVGLWWFLFSIPSMLSLRDRPGPPLKSKVSSGAHWRSCFVYISFAWMSLWKTIKVASRLRQVVIFLVAWFLLSDATATVSGTAILFARTELKMGTVAIALLSITVTTMGIAGAFLWPIVGRRFELQTNHTIVACIALMEVIPIYGLLGYLPIFKAWGVIGLQQPFEIYILGVIYGLVMGGLSSHCRSFFGQLIPPGSEAAFYALYAITDKGSSAVGPAIVGAIVDATGTIRPAFAFLAIMTALPAPLLWMVNAEKGRTDAARMAGLVKKPAGDRDSLELHAVGRVEEEEGLMRDHD
ncbi:Autophagy- protein 22 [Mollisiaceae sp. DMI_Dod_QoI]|nr:Autophagy- protein 22 [Helotiales sp. DMI_Dod_QoI]